jgi:hypothetical protein
MNPLRADMADDFKFYAEEEQDKPMTRDDVRNILLGELKNFRSDIISSWGGVGNSANVTGGNLFGFFAKQQYGSYYQSPHAVQSTVVNPTGTNAGTGGTLASGNDFGRIFVDLYNDRVSALPTGAKTGAQKTPSWVFDLPEWSQKLAFLSTGPGIYYITRTGAFTNGTILTGATSGAKATITAVFVDAADSTKGTLYISLIGTVNFSSAEIITDTAGGSATISSRTYLNTNAILRLYGVGGQEVRTDSTTVCFDKWGAVDFFCPQRYFNWDASYGFDPETISAFAQDGFTYVRLGTPNIQRIYLNGAWQNAGGSPQPVLSSRTQDISSTSVVTYAHGFTGIPKLLRFQSNLSGNYSDASYDGTNQYGLKWGTSQTGTVGGYVSYISPSGGNIALGKVTALDATNVTVSWADKVGTPTGTATIIITAS